MMLVKGFTWVQALDYLKLQEIGASSAFYFCLLLSDQKQCPDKC